MEGKTLNSNPQKVEILEEAIHRCSFCRGKGVMPSKKNIRCPVCLGNGTIKVEPPAVICAYCKGSGKSYLNPSFTCIVCKGKGIMSISIGEIEICSTCKGVGRERGHELPCSRCRGKGVVIKSKGEISKPTKKIIEPSQESRVSKKTEEIELSSEEIFKHIKERAAQIWEEEGRPQGKDFDIWLRAEKEIKGGRQDG
jgi:DnaJ-class molecular chaperone